VSRKTARKAETPESREPRIRKAIEKFPGAADDVIATCYVPGASVEEVRRVRASP
jgi:hypothetical protein